MVVKIPMILFAIALISRTVGIGMLSPLVAIIRETWIALRALVDFPTGSGGSVGGWFWAFIISLLRPSYSIAKYGRDAMFGQKDEHPVVENEGESNRSALSTSSRQSAATTHTASDSVSIRRGIVEVAGS